MKAFAEESIEKNY